MAKRAGRKSAIQQHVQQLRDLTTQFRRFERLARRTIRTHPELKHLEVELDKTLHRVIGPAYGLTDHRSRKGRTRSA